MVPESQEDKDNHRIALYLIILRKCSMAEKCYTEWFKINLTLFVKVTFHSQNKHVGRRAEDLIYVVSSNQVQSVVVLSGKHQNSVVHRLHVWGIKGVCSDPQSHPQTFLQTCGDFGTRR